jgi:hypothetical protein
MTDRAATVESAMRWSWARVMPGPYYERPGASDSPLGGSGGPFALRLTLQLLNQGSALTEQDRSVSQRDTLDSLVDYCRIVVDQLVAKADDHAGVRDADYAA